MKPIAIATVAILTAWLTLLGYVLTGLCEDSLSNAPVPPVKSETRFRRALAAARNLGEIFMSALNDALGRFTAFVANVLDQIKAAKTSNDAQTAKLAELQAALDAALSDDAADKAAIAGLQAEIAGLQDEVANQINAAVDALENPPVEVPVEAPVEAPVEVPVAETPAEPVE